MELVRGPASVLFGQVNPGGLISMTSKRPTAEAIHNVQFRTGNNNLAEGAFDFGGRLSDDGRVLYRVNGIARTQHNQVDDYKRRGWRSPRQSPGTRTIQPALRC
ncbi:hypothetical protein ACVXG7_09065 [Enterobacter hormaechei]